jgi:uncharacterized protein with NAD-binding domain and iron-sulfur cluster
MKQKVAILGGGVAGMSAAHELAERGFDVVVYENRDIPGGKARSIPVPDSGKDGKKDLSGEHGFRFFPGFYKHITDTMKRIPYKNNRQGVFDNLVEATQIAIPRFDKKGLMLPAKIPTTLNDVKLLVNTFLELIGGQIPLAAGEVEFFAGKLWQLITSCEERRLGEYEKVDWWTFVEADRFSAEYKSLLAKGLTESLVASKAKLASARTVGDIFIQLLLDLINPIASTDRLLNGPTNEVWIDPWLAHLKTFGVDYYFNSLVTSINCDLGKIKNVTIRDLKTEEIYEIQADYYIAAVPVEVMDRLIFKNNLDRYDPSFGNIRELSKNVAWMNGIQFYLKEDLPITHGHILLVDTPWALTAISQKQFWSNIDLREYGDGTVKGILSVDISNWGPFKDNDNEEESKGIEIKKYARDCTDEEIKTEVLAQLKKSLNINGIEVIKDENIHSWFLDPDIVDPEIELFQWITLPEVPAVTLDQVVAHLQGSKDLPNSRSQQEAKELLQVLIDLGYVTEVIENGEKKYISVFDIKSKINIEPLLVNLVNTWQLRPEAATRIPNLFLASDYVRTNTDLATMEGANEAARRAVNGIIGASGSTATPCKLWDLHEPEIFAPLRWHDRSRYQQGLPWEDCLHIQEFLNK